MLTDISNRTFWRETRKKQCFSHVRSNVSPQHSGNVGPTFVQRSLFCVSFPSFHSWLNVCRRERKYRSCVQRASFVYILSSDERQFYRDTEWMKTTFSRFPLCFWYYFFAKRIFSSDRESLFLIVENLNFQACCLIEWTFVEQISGNNHIKLDRAN